MSIARQIVKWRYWRIGGRQYLTCPMNRVCMKPRAVNGKSGRHMEWLRNRDSFHKARGTAEEVGIASVELFSWGAVPARVLCDVGRPQLSIAGKPHETWVPTGMTPLTPLWRWKLMHELRERADASWTTGPFATWPAALTFLSNSPSGETVSRGNLRTGDLPTRRYVLYVRDVIYGACTPLVDAKIRNVAAVSHLPFHAEPVIFIRPESFSSPSPPALVRTDFTYNMMNFRK